MGPVELWHEYNQRPTAAINLPVLNLEWDGVQFHVASTAVADDLSRQGVFFDFTDLKRQKNIWNDSLDVTLASLGLQQIRSKQQVLVISKHPELTKLLMNCPTMPSKELSKLESSFSGQFLQQGVTSRNK